MSHRRAFTIIDVLCLLVVLIFAAALVAAATGPSTAPSTSAGGPTTQRTEPNYGAKAVPTTQARGLFGRARARQLENDSRIAGICKGLMTYGSTNKDWYVGLDNTGARINEKGQSLNVEDRFRVMLLGSYFTPEFLVSPLEPGDGKKPFKSEVNTSVEDYKKLTSDNYSYALLQVPAKGGRLTEWCFTSNSQAAIVSDRNTGTYVDYASIHSTGNWTGTVGWNDAHAGFEKDCRTTTKYGTTLNQTDDILRSSGTDDAFMIQSKN